MYSVGRLRLAYRAAAAHPAPGRARRAFIAALAALCVTFLAAPRAEADWDHFGYVAPVLRIDLGPTWRFQQDGALPALTLNVNAGFGKSFGDSPVAFLGELGYTYTHQHTNAFTLGAGVGAGLPYLAMAFLMPRLVVGNDDGRAAVGLRTGLYGAFFYDIFTLEVAHQFLSAGAGLEHEARLTFGINFGTLLFMTVAGVGL